MTTDSTQAATEADPLPALRRDYPAYTISRESPGVRGTGIAPRFIATARRLGPQPHTVVTTDPAELRAALERGSR